MWPGGGAGARGPRSRPEQREQRSEWSRRPPGWRGGRPKAGRARPTSRHNGAVAELLPRMHDLHEWYTELRGHGRKSGRAPSCPAVDRICFATRRPAVRMAFGHQRAAPLRALLRRMVPMFALPMVAKTNLPPLPSIRPMSVRPPAERGETADANWSADMGAIMPWRRGCRKICLCFLGGGRPEREPGGLIRRMGLPTPYRLSEGARKFPLK